MTISSELKELTLQALKTGAEYLNAWVERLASLRLETADIQEIILFIKSNEQLKVSQDNYKYMQLKLYSLTSNAEQDVVYKNMLKVAKSFTPAMYDLARLAEQGFIGNLAGNYNLKLAVEYYQKAAERGYQKAQLALGDKIYVPVVLALKEFSTKALASEELNAFLQELEAVYTKAYISNFNHNLVDKFYRERYFKQIVAEFAPIADKYFPKGTENRNLFDQAIRAIDMDYLFNEAKLGNLYAQTQWVFRLKEESSDIIKGYRTQLDYNLHLYMFGERLMASQLPSEDEISNVLIDAEEKEPYEFGFYRLALSFSLLKCIDHTFLNKALPIINECYKSYIEDFLNNETKLSSTNYIYDCFSQIVDLAKKEFSNKPQELKKVAIAQWMSYGFAEHKKLPKFDEESLFKNAIRGSSTEIQQWLNWQRSFIEYSLSKEQIADELKKLDFYIDGKANEQKANALHLKAKYLMMAINFSRSYPSFDETWRSEAIGLQNETLRRAVEEHHNETAAYDLATMYENGNTPLINGEQSIDNFMYEEAISYYQKAADLGHENSRKVLDEKLYVPIVRALTAFKTKTDKIYASKPEVLAEINAFMKQAKSIYHEKYLKDNGKKLYKVQYKNDVAKKIEKLAISSFGKHRHRVLRIIGDVFFSILGVATIGLAYLAKKRLSGSFTFSGEETKRRKLYNQCSKDLITKNSEDEVDLGSSKKAPA